MLDSEKMNSVKKIIGLDEGCEMKWIMQRMEMDGLFLLISMKYVLAYSDKIYDQYAIDQCSFSRSPNLRGVVPVCLRN